MSACAIACCPGHLSGYFRPVYGRDPGSTGSLGAGIVISEGVTTTVWTSDTTKICVERRDSGTGALIEALTSAPPVEYMLMKMGVTARVRTECSLPIGAGFGLSAAALLSTATAVNELFSLDLSPFECGAFAHEAEIVHKTGLGDVAACMGGGRDCRKGAGIKAVIDRKFDLPDTLCAVVFGPLPSPQVLGSPEAMARVIQAYPGRCPRNAMDFFHLSRKFTIGSGLAPPEVLSALSACERAGIPATMTMLGNGVFAFGEEALHVLSGMGDTYILHPAEKGVHLVEGIRK